MALNTTLTGLSQSAAGNGPDGAADTPSTLDDAIRYALSFIAQMRDGAHVYVSSVVGTNTITGTIASNPTSYTVGQAYRFVAAAANTGAVTLNFNSIGAKNLLRAGNVALTGGELKATEVYEVVWDGVSFQLMKSIGSTLGFAQTWQDVTASRATGTTYTNTTGRPISVSASVQGTVASSTIAVSWTIGGVANINGNSVIAGAAPSNTTLSAAAIVPPGATYSLAVTQASLSNWRELR